MKRKIARRKAVPTINQHALFPEVVPAETGFQKASRSGQTSAGLRDGWQPKVDIVEADKEYLLMVEAAGVPKRDVSVQMSGRILSIFLQRRAANVGKRCRFHKVERDMGDSFRSFQVPDDAVEARPNWALEEGVLTVRLKRIAGVPEPQLDGSNLSSHFEKDLPRQSGRDRRGTSPPATTDESAVQ